jgi:drug/metabolite transporter, DME family
MVNDKVSRALARPGLSLVVLAGILWGTSGPATKAIYGMVDINPAAVAAFRMSLGAPVLLAVYYLVGSRPAARLRRRDIAWLLLMGVALGISQACYYAAIAQVGVAIATLITICSSPVLVGLFSAALLHERVTPAVFGALACALLGTTLLVGVGQGGAGSQIKDAAAGVLWAVGAAISFAAFILLSRLLANRYHPVLSIGISIAAGGVLLMSMLTLTGGITVQYPGSVWTLLLYLGLVPTALAYALFFHGVQYARAAEASIATLAEPLTSTVLAVILFGEHLGPWGVLGAALLIGAITFLYWHAALRQR